MSGHVLQILASLGTALAAGFLVGAQREFDEEGRFGGARTFPLIALAGATAMLLGVGVLIAVAAGMGLLLAVAYLRETAQRTDVGMSTETAALVTFGLGALCTAEHVVPQLSHRLLLVAASATATLALLSFKRPLHGFIARLSHEDVYATSKLLLLALIVVPILPNEDLGPWGAINPRTIGLLVLLISGIGFVGYVAVRLFGTRRGLGVTGLLGGIASSMAVTLSLAGRARRSLALVEGSGVAIVLASSIMFARLVVVVYAVSPALARAALLPFLTATVAGIAVAAFFYFRLGKEDKGEKAPELKMGNPMSLWQALRFAALFLVVLFASRAAEHYFGDRGTYVAAIVTGLADTDSIALSVARMHSTGAVTLGVARDAIGLAAVTNSVTKVVLAGVLGRWSLGWRVGVALAIAIVAALAVRFAC